MFIVPPTIEDFTVSEDDMPTEPKIPLAEFRSAVEALTDVALTAGQCFKEMEPVAKEKDHVLGKLCNDAQIACDKVVSHIVTRIG